MTSDGAGGRRGAGRRPRADRGQGPRGRQRPGRSRPARGGFAAGDLAAHAVDGPVPRRPDGGARAGRGREARRQERRGGAVHPPRDRPRARQRLTRARLGGPCPLPSPEAIPMPDTRYGILPFSQATSWPELLDVARRVDELGYDHLWAWDHLYAIFGDPYQDFFEGYSLLAGVGTRDQAGPPRAARRREHLPQPGDRRQDDLDDRPHQRRPGDRRHRRRLDGARAHGPRHRLRFRVRPAARLDGRVGERDPEAARRGVGDVRAGRPLRVQGAAPPPAAGPEAPADHDRWLRREEDAPHGRALRRHVERDGHGRRDAPQDRRAQAALRRTSGAIRTRSNSRSASRRRSATARPRQNGSGARTWSTTGRRWPTSRTT